MWRHHDRPGDPFGHLDPVVPADQVQAAVQRGGGPGGRDQVARLLDPAAIVPVHAEGWAHFSESLDDLSKAFAAAGLADRLHLPPTGEPLTS